MQTKCNIVFRKQDFHDLQCVARAFYQAAQDLLLQSKLDLMQAELLTIRRCFPRAKAGQRGWIFMEVRWWQSQKKIGIWKQPELL